MKRTNPSPRMPRGYAGIPGASLPCTGLPQHRSGNSPVPEAGEAIPPLPGVSEPFCGHSQRVGHLHNHSPYGFSPPQNQALPFPAHHVQLSASDGTPISPQDNAPFRTQEGGRSQFPVHSQPCRIPLTPAQGWTVPFVKPAQTSGDGADRAHASAELPYGLSYHILCVLQNRTAGRKRPLPSSCGPSSPWPERWRQLWKGSCRPPLQWRGAAQEAP